MFRKEDEDIVTVARKAFEKRDFFWKEAGKRATNEKEQFSTFTSAINKYLQSKGYDLDTITADPQAAEYFSSGRLQAASRAYKAYKAKKAGADFKAGQHHQAPAEGNAAEAEAIDHHRNARKLAEQHLALGLLTQIDAKGLEQDIEGLKKFIRKFLLDNHPDRNPNADMKKVQAANEINDLIKHNALAPYLAKLQGLRQAKAAPPEAKAAAVGAEAGGNKMEEFKNLTESQKEAALKLTESLVKEAGCENNYQVFHDKEDLMIRQRKSNPPTDEQTRKLTELLRSKPFLKIKKGIIRASSMEFPALFIAKVDTNYLRVASPSPNANANAAAAAAPPAQQQQTREAKQPYGGMFAAAASPKPAEAKAGAGDKSREEYIAKGRKVLEEFKKDSSITNDWAFKGNVPLLEKDNGLYALGKGLLTRKDCTQMPKRLACLLDNEYGMIALEEKLISADRLGESHEDNLRRVLNEFGITILREKLIPFYYDRNSKDYFYLNIFINEGLSKFIFSELGVKALRNGLKIDPISDERDPVKIREAFEAAAGVAAPKPKH